MFGWLANYIIFYSCRFWDRRCQGKRWWPHSLILLTRRHICHELFVISKVIINTRYLQFDLYYYRNTFKVSLAGWVGWANQTIVTCVRCSCTSLYREAEIVASVSSTDTDRLHTAHPRGPASPSQKSGSDGCVLCLSSSKVNSNVVVEGSLGHGAVLTSGAYLTNFWPPLQKHQEEFEWDSGIFILNNLHIILTQIEV